MDFMCGVEVALSAFTVMLLIYFLGPSRFYLGEVTLTFMYFWVEALIPIPMSDFSSTCWFYFITCDLELFSRLLFLLLDELPKSYLSSSFASCLGEIISYFFDMTLILPSDALCFSSDEIRLSKLSIFDNFECIDLVFTFFTPKGVI